MFDGAALVTGAEVVQEQSTQDQTIHEYDPQGLDGDAEATNNSSH